MRPVRRDAPVQVWLSNRERRRWLRAAAGEDRTLAELVREAVRERLARSQAERARSWNAHSER